MARLEVANLVDLYLRLSIDQEGKDSLERQETDLRAWAAREGLTVRRVWRDPGKSAYRDVYRKDFEQAVAAVTSGEVGTLAVWKLDRLSRHGAGQVGLLLDAVEAAHGRLYFLMDSLDSSVPGHRMVIVLVSEQARTESANTSLRVRDRKEKDRSRGRYVGGSAPMGYTVDEDRKLHQDPTEAPLVRELVDRLLAGDTLLAVARDWNERGIPTRRGGPVWRSSTLSMIVRSPALVGLMPTKRRDDTDGGWSTRTEAWRDPETGETVSIMADGTEPIVTESERLRLLDVLDSRLRRYGRGMRPVRQPQSLLGGLIYCATCKRHANSFGDSYRCRRWHESGAGCPRPLSVRIKTIDDEVRRRWAYGLAALEPDSPILAAVAERWLVRHDPAPLKERADLTADLADARARMTQADDDYYVRGTLDADRHDRVTAGLRQRIGGLLARLADLPKPEVDLGPLLDPDISLPAIMAAPITEARGLLRLAITRVEVDPAPYSGAHFDPGRVHLDWVGQPTA